ncbi:hypothetical protein BDZ89DRAFT_972050 [Hymenopellis radicata]|nr:hypothetical protein BDZ89DRAFT_972050 [Hymenopellis radicata]
MLNTAVQYKCAIRNITSEDTLLDYALTNTEWLILDQLREILKDATLYFSRDDANLASVIPAMDKLGRMLSTAVITKSKTDKVTLCKPLKAALLVAKDTLDKYYLLSDSSEVYRLALILHPKYKLGYFDDLGWLDDWKQDASDLVTRVFDEYLTVYTAAAGNVTVSTATTTTSADPTQVFFSLLIFSVSTMS